MIRTNGNCCRLAHVLHAAEAEFGPEGSCRELARRALGHGAHSPVVGSFLIQWELMLRLGPDAPLGPAVCDDCFTRLTTHSGLAQV